MKKNFQWVIAAALLICGTTVTTSCHDVVEHAVDGLFEPLNKKADEAEKERKQELMDNLSRWNIGSATDQESVNKFGYDNCFKVVELTPEFWAGKDAPAVSSSSSAANLCMVRFLTTNSLLRDNKQIGISAVICNKAIANDLLFVFRKLYEAHYDILHATTAAGYCRENLMNLNCTYSYFFDENKPDDASTQELQGLCVVVNANKSIGSDDMAVKLLKQRGFAWGGDAAGGKTWYFEKK